MIQPDLFIPAAEETGVIVRLGREVLIRSLERLAREQKTDPDSHDARQRLGARDHARRSARTRIRRDQSGRRAPGNASRSRSPKTRSSIRATGAGAVLERLRAGGVRDVRRRFRRDDPTLTMHVNVSVQEIMHGDLPEHVFAALKATGVRPETVTLEITENAIIDTSTGAGACSSGCARAA